jgi:asparagine synthase (glutamine-hydrolysing)
MCGIFGAVNLAGAPLRSREDVLGMGELLRHRGPDSGGVLESGNAILGSRRLSIIDLSSEADQPFASPDGRVWLVCNGEIYNSPELRRRYASAGYPFRSQHNDVEAILPLYLEQGEKAVEQLEGMFALAIWDARRGELLLARDRAGEKPLFFCERAGELRFGSEIQVLLSAETSGPEISRDGLSDYLTLGYCTAPRTMFAGIEKLEAAHYLVADAHGIRHHRYWNAIDLARNERKGSAEDLTETFSRAVQRQVMSDVPIGVFTSGGLDSSLLAAEAIRHWQADAVHTYAVKFEDASYDESRWATRVCQELGTIHHTVCATEGELQRALGVVTNSLAEPLGDPAILPTFLLAEAAAGTVKAILSGEGADELFGGYPTYIGHRWAEGFRRLPASLRGALRGAVRRLPVSSRKVSLEFLARRFVDEAERDTALRHLAWFGSHGPDASNVGLDCKPSDGAALWSGLDGIRDPVKRAMVFDQLTYLAENLLTKVDRATMLASVEARAPFLDREVMEFALQQPVRTGVGWVETKRALKRAALARLPRAVVHRRKRGLSVPVSNWINEGMRDEFDRLLDPERLRRQGLIDPSAVTRLLAAHRGHEADHGRRLWPLLILQRWHERWFEGDTGAAACVVEERPPAALHGSA